MINWCLPVVVRTLPPLDVLFTFFSLLLLFPPPPPVLIALVVLVAGVRWYIHNRELEIRAVYIMVDRILGKPL